MIQLELGYNPIGPDGAKTLCETLKFHGKIETLKLGWCQVAVVSCFFNHLMITYFFGINYWIVRFSQIRPKGAEYVADALKYNTTISTLDLRANGLGDDVGK